MPSETAWLHPVEPETGADGAARLARLAGWALVAGVAGAAAWAVVVLLSREVNVSWAQFLGSVLVLLIATTVIAPILRRRQRPSAIDSAEPAIHLAA